MSDPVRVLFVCLGNICRSPTAHGLFRDLVHAQGFDQKIAIDSAGTGDWHVGRQPDERAIIHALDRDIDIRDLKARTVAAEDFDTFDYILAMDKQNLVDLEAMRPDDFDGYLGLFLDFSADDSEREVPDPYYGEKQGFQYVLDLVEKGSEGLLDTIRKRYGF